MTQLDQIKALAAQGVSLKDAEAVVGRAFTPEETAAFRKTATLRRLRRALFTSHPVRLRLRPPDTTTSTAFGARAAATSFPASSAASWAA